MDRFYDWRNASRLMCLWRVGFLASWAFRLLHMAGTCFSISGGVGRLKACSTRRISGRCRPLYRLYENEVLVAVPIFIFMGVMLEGSQMPNSLFAPMGKMFRNMRVGWYSLSVLVARLLAAYTGCGGRQW